jgi:hypothetical protein
VVTQVVTEPLEAGLHVRRVDEPLKRAVHIANDLSAVLCATTVQVDEHLAGLAAPPLTAVELADLRSLAERVASAQRIIDATLDRAALGVGERLSATGSGVAVHPSAVRDRATAVHAARAALADAKEQLLVKEAAAEEAAAARASTDGSAVHAEPIPVRSADGEAPPRWWQFSRRRRARERREDDGASEVSSLLQQVAASTDEAFGARRANEARNDRGVLARATRDRAVEDLRVAERAWRDLAGADPVEDVEAVVRRFDPQHQDAVELARASTGVRAAEALRAAAVRRWREGWEKSGYDAPTDPDVDAFDEMVDRLGQTVVLVAAAVERADDLVAASRTAAVVVVVVEDEDEAGG